MLAPRNMTAPLNDIEAKVREGAPLDAAGARAILAEHDLIAIGRLADTVRRRHHGDRVTYVRILELDVDQAPPAEPPPDVAPGEIRITGSISDLATAQQLVRTVKSLAAPTPITGFALDAVVQACARENASLADTLARLHDAGLDLIAEAAADPLANPAAILDAVPAAGLKIGRLVVKSDNGPDDLGAILAAFDLLRRSGGNIEAFAPLARSDASPPSTGYDDVKRIAVARLLAREGDRIQVDWARHGPKLAQVALMFGVDDLDAVPALDAVDLGVRRSAHEEVRRNITAAGFVSVERNGRFEILST